METVLKQERITKQAVLRLSEQMAEPGWVRESRLRAFEVFQSLPWPTGKEEAWRKTKIRHFQGEHFFPPRDSFAAREKAPNRIDPNIVRKFLNEKNIAGWIVQEEARLSSVRISDTHSVNSVILAPLSEAARQFPQRLRPILEENQWPVNPEKLELLQSAFWNTGRFVGIPKNTAVKHPIFLLTHLRGKSDSVFPATIISAEAHSRATIVEIATSTEVAQESLAVNRSVRILAGEGAEINYFLLILDEAVQTSFTSLRAQAERNSSVNLRLYSLANRLSKTHLNLDFQGEGARGDVQGVFFASGRQQMDFNTVQNHLKGHTESNLNLKGAVGDSARSSFRGVIHIIPQAQETNAYQINKNLLLSRQAHADSNPVLEIEANEVHCSHGATAGPVDKEQLFYLESRGLSPQAARQLIVEGYFNEVISLLPSELLRKAISRAIARKIKMSHQI